MPEIKPMKRKEHIISYLKYGATSGILAGSIVKILVQFIVQLQPVSADVAILLTFVINLGLVAYWKK